MSKTKIRDLYSVTPKDYQDEMGVSERTAQTYFKRMLTADPANFKQIGSRVYASRTWFERERSIKNN